MTTPTPHILLLSAYDAASHRQWRQGLTAQFPQWHWTQLSLPPRHFAWRMRGNALSWFASQRPIMQQRYDLVILTSMCDWASIRGLFPNLAHTPSILYFHENQFAYPVSHHQAAPLEAQMVSIYSVLAADVLVFNSDYNRQTFATGVRTLLQRLPDFSPPALLDEKLEDSVVLAVPLADALFHTPPPRDLNRPLNIVWSHRWEYDKAPERFFAALQLLQESGIDFRLHLLGQRFRQVPPVFATMQARFATQTLHWGPIEAYDDYLNILRHSDVVVSSALHDFQGVAVLEATACGCIPVVPDRLAYREIFPDHCRYASHPDDATSEAHALAAHLSALSSTITERAPDLSSLSWSKLSPHYQALLQQTMTATISRTTPSHPAS